MDFFIHMFHEPYTLGSSGVISQVEITLVLQFLGSLLFDLEHITHCSSLKAPYQLYPVIYIKLVIQSPLTTVQLHHNLPQVEKLQQISRMWM